MRKIAAILLLGGLLYNWLGYMLVYEYLQHRADQQLVARLDQHDYDDSRLLEIKLPLHLPYQSTWSDYERYDGDIEIDGVHYKYVKRRVCNDTLYLLCLPNDSRQKIQDARNDFFKHINDLPAKKSSTPTGGNNLVKSIEYRPEQNHWTIAAPFLTRPPYSSVACRLHTLYIQDTPAQPPEAPAA